MKISMRPGRISVEYDGRLPRGLDEFLSQTRGVRVQSSRPLVVETSRPERVVARMMRFLSSREMRARRVTVEPGPGSSLPDEINPPPSRGFYRVF